MYIYISDQNRYSTSTMYFFMASTCASLSAESQTTISRRSGTFTGSVHRSRITRPNSIISCMSATVCSMSSEMASFLYGNIHIIYSYSEL